MDKQYQKLSVVPYTSKRLQQMMVGVVILGYLLVASAGYWGGYNHSRVRMEVNAIEINQLRKRNATLEEEEIEFKATQVKQAQELMLERETIELLRKENMEQQGKISFLEQELILFQRVVKTNNDARGLVLGRLELEAGVDSTFELSLDIIQITGRGRVKGRLYLEVEGFDSTQNGEMKTLLLHQISDAHTKDNVALNFTNYQSVNLAVRLPEGFTPHQIMVRAKFDRGKKVTLEERYDWAVKG